MKVFGCSIIVLGACIGVTLLAGCEKRPDEGASDPQPISRFPREQRAAPVASRISQDDSLYGQILETMQQENKELKQQIRETAEKCAQLETELNDIRLERDVAFKAYLKVSDSINSLKTDAGSKDTRIKELEQANQTQGQTIDRLNQQVQQLLLELNNTGSSNSNNASSDPQL